MSLRQRAPGRRRARFRIAAVLLVIVVPTAVVSCHSQIAASAGTPPTVATSSSPAANTELTTDPHESLQADDPHGVIGVADGRLPDGVAVSDDEYPGVSRVDPALLSALRHAARDAGHGLLFYVTSGWRSAAYQEQLLDQAVSTYGSRAAAARWVATPTTSPHVTGHAVDLGHSDATTWLSKHGATYGLCQIYRNEPWHFELRPAARNGCPTMYADPTHDPRMTQ